MWYSANLHQCKIEGGGVAEKGREGGSRGGGLRRGEEEGEAG